MTKPKKKIWLTRDKDNDGWYALFEGRPPPQIDIDGIWRATGNRNRIDYFCHKTFKRITGVELEPGKIREVKEIKFVIEEIK
ncbi:MAG: hypothetical protein ACUZ77_09300 [Candidatus Brocadiales bacterium]